jgi:hypothetical protein
MSTPGQTIALWGERWGGLVIRRLQLLCATALVLALGVPGIAAAQLDLQIVDVQLFVETLDGRERGAELFVIVEGSNIDYVTMKIPGSGEVVALDALDPVNLPGVFFMADFFRSLGRFTQSYPSGTYTFTFNGVRTVNVSLTFASPPAPSISSPAHRTRFASLHGDFFAFDACGAGCLDTTVLLFDDGDDPIAEEFIPSTSTTWMSPFPLAPQTRHDLLVLNTTIADQPGLMAQGDMFDLYQTRQHFESVQFTTGGAFIDDAPLGMFGIGFGADTHPVHDPSGAFVYNVAGFGVDLVIAADARGKISGTGFADADQNGSYETPVAVRGRVRTKGSEVTVDLRIRGRTDDVMISLQRRETFDVAAGITTVKSRASGRVGDVRVRMDDEDVDALPAGFTNDLDWTLDVTLQTLGTKVEATAVLTYAAGSTFNLEGTGRFNDRTGASTIRLKGADDAAKGVRIGLRNLRTNGPAITGTGVMYGVLGARGRASVGP